MIILLHSSKTMRPILKATTGRQPELLRYAEELNAYLLTLAPSQLARIMHISPSLARKTQDMIANWLPTKGMPAMDCFVGDIYSGLQADSFTPADRKYADTTLRILSGLYGVVRPLDTICPYRLEMGYRLPSPQYKSLYDFWGRHIVDTLPKTGAIVNASSVEYSQTIIPFVDPARVITPKFLTVDPKTGEPTFKVVHAKIARGAFARWLIISRAKDPADFSKFADLGYAYNAGLSGKNAPAFVCTQFGGIGLSMRLK